MVVKQWNNVIRAPSCFLKTVKVELVGEGGRLLYEMPAFQRASVHTAYEYFRWNVTNPMDKYRAW